MKKLLLCFLLSASIFACSTKDNTKNQELFNKNVASFNKAIDAFVAEDAELFASYFADSVKWCGPDKKLLTEYNTKAGMI